MSDVLPLPTWESARRPGRRSVSLMAKTKLVRLDEELICHDGELNRRGDELLFGSEIITKMENIRKRMKINKWFVGVQF